MTIDFTGWQQTSPGVFQSGDETVLISNRAFPILLEQAKQNAKRRARICAHSRSEDAVHEMLICLLQECQVRPHCHEKYESLHVIEGSCDLVLFDPHGRITNVVPLGLTSEDTRYVRLQPELFHTLIVRSEYVVFHETVEGPFRREKTRYAEWAPSEDAAESLGQYFRELDETITKMRPSEPDAS